VLFQLPPKYLVKINNKDVLGINHGHKKVVILQFDWHDHMLLSYCGDSRPIDPKIVEGTEILMHECTFMTPDEVESAHSSLPEVIKVAKKSKCKKLVLYHLSERYLQENKIT